MCLSSVNTAGPSAMRISTQTAPSAAIPAIFPASPGTHIPEIPKSTWDRPSPRSRTKRNDGASVTGGAVLGWAMTFVTPPAAASAVPDEKSSLWV